MLLHGRPATFAQAIKDATEIEYALNFEKQSEPEQEVYAIAQPNFVDHPKLATSLQQTLEQMVKRLEALETKLQLDVSHTSALRHPLQNHLRGNCVRNI